MEIPDDPKRALLRHTVATMAYRGAKVLRGAPPDFGTSRLGPGTRTPAEILSHIADLFTWAANLASSAPLDCEAERLFQGPSADALTHFGQLGLLRRRAGAPVRGENYFKAEIRVGVIGPEQAEPRVEFD